jgi:endonuclease G, mitochondrial
MRKSLGTYIGITLMIIMLMFTTIFTFAQDVVVLKHTNYTSHYSKSKKYPVMVEWWITRAKVGCPTPMARKDNFKPDPLLPNETNLLEDYKGSGTDRGHMMPAAENLCQTPAVQDESFYFSNMAAQYHSLNAGDWKSVETMEREWAKKDDSVHVWCGNIGEAKRIGRVAVPKQCWKVIYFVKSKEWMCFLFDNNTSKPDGIHNNLVDKSDIEKLTGFKFK